MGFDVYASPHDGNVSNSLVFAMADSYGNPINVQYANHCLFNEVAKEIIQTKGQSVTHPALSS